MAQETYFVIIDNPIRFGFRKEIAREQYAEFGHAINAARSYEAYYGDWVIGWTITRASDGVVLAERKS